MQGKSLSINKVLVRLKEVTSHGRHRLIETDEETDDVTTSEVLIIKLNSNAQSTQKRLKKQGW
jgi:hypothetical protein